MKIPCDKRVTCPDPNLVLSNYSSEAPDRIAYFGRYYVGPGGPNFAPTPTRGNTIIGPGGCTSFSSSFFSVSDANLCAARESAECTAQSNVNDPCTSCDAVDPRTGQTECCDPNSNNRCCCTPEGNPGGTIEPPPDPPQPTLFPNTPQSCQSQCADGGTYTYTVPAGMFVAQSQGQANLMAHTYACQQAAINKMCINCLSIIEGKCDNPYDATIQVTGGVAPYTLTLSPDTPLPQGLQFLNGRILGTPTGLPSTTLLTITVQDSSLDQLNRPSPRSVTQDCYLVITGPKFLNAPIDGKECDNYGHEISGGFFFQTSPSGCTFTATGLPEGLTLHSSGLLDGVALERGSFLITVTAVDPVGNEQNSKQFVINIQTIAGDVYSLGGTSVWQCAKSLKDFGQWLQTNGGVEGINGGPLSIDFTNTTQKNVLSLTAGPGNGGLTTRFRRRVAASACSAGTTFTLRMTIEWHPAPGGSIKIQAYNMGTQVDGLDFTQFYGSDGSESVIVTSPIHTAIGVSDVSFDFYLPLNTFATAKITSELI